MENKVRKGRFRPRWIGLGEHYDDVKIRCLLSKDYVSAENIHTRYHEPNHCDVGHYKKLLQILNTKSNAEFFSLEFW